jgi:deoxyribonuclease V
MIVAFDVHYLHDGRASAAAVLFSEYRQADPEAVYTICLMRVAEYVPGAFFKRELPCILELMDRIPCKLKEAVVDGNVRLGEAPGLGWHLYEALARKVPVIGVAKSRCRGFSGAEVLRGMSRRPLYVTAAGLELPEACRRVESMHGGHRLPRLLKLVDREARSAAQGSVD